MEPCSQKKVIKMPLAWQPRDETNRGKKTGDCFILSSDVKPDSNVLDYLETKILPSHAVVFSKCVSRSAYYTTPLLWGVKNPEGIRSVGATSVLEISMVQFYSD